ncbi:hypothetical protein GLW08_21360 [Pontibacillus yanchengensis]|uniref:Uncharacterized protein n=2 Tax=Pontibacillus yanchengensis TaxID=462910 RepID=A0ACC7VM40_9BACI|nr:hypothetical protein [Pontibacillus yanchengensis]MYL35433.1 hypothetical protein [Pontibacillus yanchengensis]MYL55852.1 hypothetical protein [Pontibacillus yanchengensis]
MIHQLKRIERDSAGGADNILQGLSKDEHHEYLWKVTIKHNKIRTLFVSKRSLILMNGTPGEWMSQLTVPDELRNHLNDVAAKIGELYKTVKVS